MTSRWNTSTHPSLYEINTWPWLRGLSATVGRDIDLGSVPDEYWDAIAERGFDAVWLMGVWARSPAGVRIAMGNPELVSSFRDALADFEPDDVVGSPYCIRDYVVDPALGGPDGLAAARAALSDAGTRPDPRLRAEPRGAGPPVDDQPSRPVHPGHVR